MNRQGVNVFRLPLAEAHLNNGLSTHGLMRGFGFRGVKRGEQVGFEVRGPIFKGDASAVLADTLPTLGNQASGLVGSPSAFEQLYLTTERFARDADLMSRRLSGLLKQGQIPTYFWGKPHFGHFLDAPDSQWQLVKADRARRHTNSQLHLGDSFGRLIELGAHTDPKATFSRTGYRTPLIGATVALWTGLDHGPLFKISLYADTTRIGDSVWRREMRRETYARDVAEALSWETGDGYQESGTALADARYTSRTHVQTNPWDKDSMFDVFTDKGTLSMTYHGGLTMADLEDLDGPMFLPVPQFVFDFHGAIEDALMTGNALPAG